MEISGKWLFKELGDIEYQGILCLTDNSIKLVIIDNLPINTFSYPVRFSIVTGKTIEGLFTLVDVVYHGNFRQNYKSQLLHKTLYPKEIFRGKLFEIQSDLNFHNFKFEIDGLKEWFDLECINEIDLGSNVRIEYDKPKPIQICLENWGTITFDFTESSFFQRDEYNTIYQLKQFVTISLNSKKVVNYKGFLDFKKKINFFFLLVFGKETEVFRQIFLCEEDKLELVYFDDFKEIKHRIDDRTNFAISYLDISGQFDKILNEFLSLYDGLYPTLNIWVGFLMSGKLNNENSFLLTCQSLEAWHRRFHEGNENYEKGEYKTYHGSKSPYFKTRIKKLLEFSESEFESNIFSNESLSYDDISEKVTNTRDYFTHYLIEEKCRWSENQILNYTPKLIKLIHALMLEKIGVDKIRLKEFINSTSYSKYNNLEDISYFPY